MKAAPSDVYNALTNKTMLEIWTGETAEMVAEPNTEFSLWNGSISGMNLDKKGTSVELYHTNIPDEAFENISEGWDEDYFGALKELFI